MTYELLKGLRIIEISAFVAAPLAGLTLAQLGAEVIRIDPPGGGIDNRRWPLASDGDSLYWHGLNRAKKSIFLDLKTARGQSTLHQLIDSKESEGGIVLTNLGGPDWLQFDTLKKVRPDLILVELTGHHDGSTAVDYTVNAAVGIPAATGTPDNTGPVNHVLPAWDGMAGLTLSTALLAALRARDKTGKPQHLRIALSDVAVGFLGNLGILPEAELSGQNRERQGNHVYGTFGHSLPCKDGRYVMVVAMTRRHWKALLSAAQIEKDIQQLEETKSLDLFEEADRYQARHDVYDLLKKWSQEKSYKEVADALTQHSALWGPYQTFTQLLDDSKLVTANPLVQQINHASIGSISVPGSTIRINGAEEGSLKPGPAPGADTQSVLEDLKGSGNPDMAQRIRQDITPDD